MRWGLYIFSFSFSFFVQFVSIILHVLVAVDVWLLFELMPALAAEHTDILHSVAIRRAHRKRAVDMAALVDGLATYLACVLGQLQSQIALRAAEGVAFSVSRFNSERFATYPDVEAEDLNFSYHCLLRVVG